MIAEATTVAMSDGACAVIQTNAGEWGRFPAQGDLAAPLDRFEVNNQPGERITLKLFRPSGAWSITVSKHKTISDSNKNFKWDT